MRNASLLWVVWGFGKRMEGSWTQSSEGLPTHPSGCWCWLLVKLLFLFTQVLLGLAGVRFLTALWLVSPTAKLYTFYSLLSETTSISIIFLLLLYFETITSSLLQYKSKKHKIDFFGEKMPVSCIVTRTHKMACTHVIFFFQDLRTLITKQSY